MNRKAIALVIGAGLVACACSSHKEATRETGKRDTAITKVQDSLPGEQLCGAYTRFRELEKEDADLFKSTYKGDTKLTPNKVATQVVAGTNYSFLCSDKNGQAYEVIIFEPLPGQGKPEVSEVRKIEE